VCVYVDVYLNERKRETTWISFRYEVCAPKHGADIAMTLSVKQ